MEGTFAQFTEANTAFIDSVHAERALAVRKEQVLSEFGRARSKYIALQQTLRVRDGHSSAALLDTIEARVAAISALQPKLETQKLVCEVLARTLGEIHEQQKRAAEAVGLAISKLRKQARELLEARYGKQRLFSLWSDDREQTYLWRRSMLNTMLALAGNDAERACALLECFFREKPHFALHVRRGFRIEGDAGMRDIRPTVEGEAYAVPKDLPLRDAFEGVLAGRAEIAAVA